METVQTVSLDHFPVGCLISDPSRRICFSNRDLQHRCGYSDAELKQLDLFALLSKASQILFDSFIMPLIVQEGRCDEIRLTLVAKDGQSLPAVVSAYRESAPPAYIYWAVNSAHRSETLFQELNDTKELLNKKVALLRTLAETDALTGLPNRRTLTQHLEHEITRHQGVNFTFALAFIDLDGFKQINDTHGHDTGDQVLRLAANRLVTSVSPDDLVSRFGGDEFVIYLNGYSSPEMASEILISLLDTLSRPIELDALTLTLSASIGITFYPQTGDPDIDQLIRQADQAMYQAKLAGRDGFKAFDIHVEEGLRANVSAVNTVKTALEQDQFELFYQPKVNMLDGRVSGAEALIRWQHPEEGLKTPHSFIKTLSDTTTGRALGRFVIRQALIQLRAWHAKGLDLAISINLDGYHLQHPGFLDELACLLAEFSDVPPHYLELEVLETSAIEDAQHVSSVIAACQKIGIKVSLDDFGMGYSTLGHLRDLTVDTLKIDRSFVQRMLESPGDLAIIKGVIAFARAFECDVIAEGVETRQHGECLIELGCFWAQGFYMACPMPAVALEAWLGQWQQRLFHQKFMT